MIVAFCGPMNSGKDTASHMLRDIDSSFKKISFASVIKDLVSIAMSWDRGLLEGITEESRLFREKKDEWWSEKLGMEITPRFMLQFWGTDLIRNHLHKDFWIFCMEKKLASGNFVITDLRFENEFDFIQRLGGVCVKLKRGESGGAHISETSLLHVRPDYVISNTGSVDELRENVSLLYEYICKRGLKV